MHDLGLIRQLTGVLTVECTPSSFSPYVDSFPQKRRSLFSLRLAWETEGALRLRSHPLRNRAHGVDP